MKRAYTKKNKRHSGRAGPACQSLGEKTAGILGGGQNVHHQHISGIETFILLNSPGLNIHISEGGYVKKLRIQLIVLGCGRSAAHGRRTVIINEGQNSFELTRHIGSTTYKVKVYLAEDGTGTIEDKILRIIRNNMLEMAEDCDILGLPQTSRQSERSA